MVINVLKQTLKKEFGSEKYKEYAAFIKENIKTSKIDTSELFNDIYHSLQGKDRSVLEEMWERLNYSMAKVFQISRGYLAAFIAYLAAFVVIASYAIEIVAFPGLLTISVLFLLKTYEYVVNKFCYIDMHLVLVYRSALEEILKSSGWNFR